MKETFQLAAQILSQRQELQKQLNELDKQYDVVKDSILAAVKEQLKDDLKAPLVTEFGTFRLASKANWQYSNAVAELQATEKKVGLAKEITSEWVVFHA